jgi:ABC-type multidrug transport system permease subunit
VIAILVRAWSAWRQAIAVTLAAMASGAMAFLVAQGYLGGLPGEHLSTWVALSLTILAMAASTAGFIALIGPPGLGISALLFVFIGNPFSGATSAPTLLPAGVHDIGQWLPPGAGASLLRSTAYFGDNGASAHLVVLLVWTVVGLAAIVAGHHGSPRFVAYQHRHAELAASRA